MSANSATYHRGPRLPGIDRKNDDKPEQLRGLPTRPIADRFSRPNNDLALQQPAYQHVRLSDTERKLGEHLHGLDIELHARSAAGRWRPDRHPQHSFLGAAPVGRAARDGAAAHAGPTGAPACPQLRYVLV